MKYVSEKTYKYMNRIWGFSSSDQTDDMTMFWESDCPELVCKRLVDAGAVYANCPEAIEMIEVAESINPDWEKETINLILEDYKTLRCTNCNRCYFIPNYLDEQDWINGSCDSCDKLHFIVKE